MNTIGRPPMSYPDKPRLYKLNGAWYCAQCSGQWTIWPYGVADSMTEAFTKWKIEMARLAAEKTEAM